MSLVRPVVGLWRVGLKRDQPCNDGDVCTDVDKCGNPDGAGRTPPFHGTAGVCAGTGTHARGPPGPYPVPIGIARPPSEQSIFPYFRHSSQTSRPRSESQWSLEAKS